MLNFKHNKMKRIGLTSILLLLINTFAWACPVCERQQPKLLRGIIHGAGPEHQWDYIIIIAVAIITIATLFFSVKWLIKPGEKSDKHIKRMVLDQDEYEGY